MVEMRLIPVLNGDHDLAVLDSVELFESVELEPPLVLLVDVQPLQDCAA